MQARRTGRFAGVYRLYCPRRRCYSVRLWFSEERAQRAARRWAWGMFEVKPDTIIQADTDQ